MAEKILRTRDVVERVGLSRTSLWRKEQAGDFPRRRVIGSGIVGWVEREVDDWIQSRPVVPSSRDAANDG